MSLGHGASIVRNGLVLYLDAANPKSYPGSGTTWKDLSGNGNNGTLVNGPTFNSANGGSIVFDGTNDYVITTNLLNPTTNPNESVFVWFNPTAAGQIVSELGQATINTGWHDSVSYTHLTLPTTWQACRSRWSPYH